MYYISEEGEEIELRNEQDYMDLIQYATDNNLDQVEIIIKKNENISEKRKESYRKKSSMKNEDYNYGYEKKNKSKLPKIKDEIEIDDDNESDGEDEKEVENGKGGGNNGDDGEMGMQCEYDYFGDTRNRKGMNEEGYNKKNKGVKEAKRVYYIKEKNR